jgi:hypothetical protein
MAKRTDVGFGRPPKEHQFKPGQSGNPKGRPKRTPTFHSEMMAELFEEIEIKEDGRSVRVTKYRALLKATLAKAVAGDMKAQKLILEIASEIAAVEAPANENDAPEDDAIIAAFLRRKSGGGGRDE